MILLLDLSGCGTGDRYNFSRNREKGDVIYTVGMIGSTSQETTGTITYIGEKSPSQKINYKISGKEGTNIGIEDGMAAVGNRGVIQEGEERAIEILWDGQTENTVLTTDN